MWYINFHVVQYIILPNTQCIWCFLLIFLVFSVLQKPSSTPLSPCDDNFPYRKYNLTRNAIKEFQKYFKNKKESAFIMKKQTKLVAVLSTAALLAIGASMTSLKRLNLGSFTVYAFKLIMIVNRFLLYSA